MFLHLILSSHPNPKDRSPAALNGNKMVNVSSVGQWDVSKPVRFGVDGTNRVVRGKTGSVWAGNWIAQVELGKGSVGPGCSDLRWLLPPALLCRLIAAK